MNIAILGGSFNPIHIGHLWAAQQVLELENIDSVVLMPTYSSEGWNKNVAGFEYRLNMCYLANREFDNSFSVFDIEVRKKFEYTYQTIDHLTDLNPNNTYFWVLGSDWNEEKFKNYEELKKKCKFINLNRIGAKELPSTCEIEFCLSSTVIRERIKRRKKITGLVTQGVEKYISEKRLYL